MDRLKIAPASDLCNPICRKILSALTAARPAAFLAAAFFLAAGWVSLTNAEAVKLSGSGEWVAANIEELVKLYRELHSHPELSLQEEKTAARIADELRAAGAKVTTGIGGHGVVGVLENGLGKVLLLRADMDALPVVEETKLPYASQVKAKNDHGATVGVMHACGHDIHMTNLVAVARFLAANRELWKGTVVFLFQPAEELGRGAQNMLDDGLMDRIPRPDYAVALHVASDVPTGKVTFRPGYALANVDSIDIVIKGRGGHGAHPETTIDPIVIAARLIVDLQSIVSREIKPTEPAVVTVGSIHAGTKHNIIPDDCRLQITVRSYTPEVRMKLHEAIRRKALAAAASAGAPEPEIDFSEGTPALFNDLELTERVAKSLRRTLGEENVVDGEPSMGGEDFSRYGVAGVPICMFRLGAVNQERLDDYKADGKTPPSLHSPLFYPDAAEALTTGVPAMAAVAIDLLAPEEAAAAGQQ